MLDLKESTDLCALLADASRLRLLALLEVHALSAAELTEVTGLAQSRVSTHLTKLKAGGLVQEDRGQGARLYSAQAKSGPAARLWAQLRTALSDALLRADLERAEGVLRARERSQSWADSVAGRMERHYSPGRTWEATAHALTPLLRLGKVLDLASGDGVIAELLAPRCEAFTCIDISEAVLAAAGRRLATQSNVRLMRGDMHALPCEAAQFDVVLCLHALAYTDRPAQVLSEVQRVLKPGGVVVIAALLAHEHRDTVLQYDHRNQGFDPQVLRTLMASAGLEPTQIAVTSREPRPPYFEVITALGSKR